MSIYAVTGSSLFQWEQSAVTEPMAPIIPAALYCTTILCTFALPLSMLVANRIECFQRAVEECPEQCANNDIEHSADSQEPEYVKEEQGSLKKSPNTRQKKKCKCVTCMPRVRRFIVCSLFRLCLL